jgi:glycolate oxidase
MTATMPAPTTAPPAPATGAGPGRTAELAARLRSAVGGERVLTDPAQLRTYECDGLANYRVQPGIVVLAESRQHVVDTVRLCSELGVPFVARGSGTGLSGGALPVAEGVLLVLSRLRALGPVDPDNARVVVEPGVINLWVTRDATPHGLAYAPDPSSQQVCSIGGNVAENAGGAHCLKYGFTVNHVLGAEVVLPDGEVVHLGGVAPEHPGYDLLGAFIGSEGTLGVATSLTLRLVRVPEAVQTMLVGFTSVEDAAGCVSDIIAEGILPAAIEMMDALAIEAAEAAVHCGYPEGATAVLVIELDGPEVEVEAQFAQVEQIALARNAFETRIAANPAERALMWKGRKSAFAAVGRISPAYFVQDGVIPRTQLPEVLGEIGRMADEVGLRVANVFHAGDGNLHPLVLFDDAVEGQGHDAEELAGAILELCVRSGGSITGEHGVGAEKKMKMSFQFTEADLDSMQLVRCAFDPDGIANPGKLFPTPRLCGERPGVRTADHPVQAAGLGEVF